MPTRTDWTAARRAELVLELLRGSTPLGELARSHGLRPAELEAWRVAFLRGAERALGDDAAPPAPRRVFADVAQAVGDTPLVRLNRVVAGLQAEVYAKLELMNPTGSIKDRTARHMVELAAADGRLSPGQTVVESSSGNTAMGLGMMAVLGGYRCAVAVRDTTSREKLSALRALGVELRLVDASLPPEHPESYNQIMPRILAENPGCYFPDQHNNRENNAAHYATTGPEIWEQMEGRIDLVVCGMGTGGTLGGVARYLKEQDPSIRVIAVDVEGSIFTDYYRTGRVGQTKRYRLEGLGDELPIGCVEWELLDGIVQVSDREAFLCARELARKEAIFAGGSSGAALWGVRQVLRDLDPGERPARVVTVFPDGGHRYLSTIYDDGWMRAHGYLED